MLKKVLIAFGILAIIGIVGLLFIGNKIDTAIKEKEPEFRQYIQMTVEEQNAYVEKNMNDLMQWTMRNADQERKILFDRITNDPEIHAAAIEFGRSVVAGLIMGSEPIVKDMTEDIKAKIQAEVDAMDARSDRYSELIKKYDIQKFKKPILQVE